MNRKKINVALIFFILILINISIIFGQVNVQTRVFGQTEDLDILNKWIKWSNSGSMLINQLNKQAFDYLDLRDAEISKLKTKSDWLQRQQKAKEIFANIMGPFPDKTPLNPVITSVLQKNGFRVEKIVYESIPKFYVTSCMFIPDGAIEKRPAIIYVSGHTIDGFRTSSYLNVIQNFVKKGFIVFAIDPIGQGERYQYYDIGKKDSIIGAGVEEHTYCGNQCFVSGSSLAMYFTWDIIRGVDYLLTRKEVDSEKIGITGRSGGGTQSAYAFAYDERIKATAPEAYITSPKRLLESAGSQDAESFSYHSIKNGFSYSDFFEVRAPDPALIITTTRDYFVIQGARETYREALKAYKSFEKPENLQMAEDDSIHSTTKKNREATYKFFQEKLNFPGNFKEEDVEILKPEELCVTSTGQVSTSLGSENVFSINKKYSQKLIERLEGSRKNIKNHLEEVRIKAKELSGYIAPLQEGEPVFCGRYQRNGYCIEMYVLQGEGDCVIPLLLFIPDGNDKFPAVIYLHPDGKKVNASVGGEIEKIVKKGFIVAAPDLIGIGETKNKSGRYLEYIIFNTNIYIGRSIVGIQAGDVIRVANYLKTLNNVEKEKIIAVAIGELGPVLLHAAAFDNSISKIALINSPISYNSIVMNMFYKVNIHNTVAGALTAYDLPDLIGCIAPGKVILVNLNDHMLKPASTELINQELVFPRSVYSLKNASENLKIVSQFESMESIVEMCFK